MVIAWHPHRAESWSGQSTRASTTKTRLLTPRSFAGQDRPGHLRAGGREPTPISSETFLVNTDSLTRSVLVPLVDPRDE